MNELSATRLQTSFDHIPAKQAVVICVCTCMRPIMLERCLRSLGGLTVPHDVAISLVVVDNNPQTSAAVVVNAVRDSIPFPVIYTHEPRRGIASARNAGIRAANKAGANWLTFIDDDEIADVDWLVHLMAHEYRATPVLMGKPLYVFPDPLPFWGVSISGRAIEEGRSLKTAYTNNVRISMALIEAGLTFDEGIGLAGGEDNEFFASATVRGFNIRQTNRAITHEFVHPERLTYFSQAYRAYWCAASDVRMHAIRKSWGWVFTHKVHTVPLNIVFGIAGIVAAPLAIVAGVRAFKLCALWGGKKMAKGLGRAAGFIGVLPKPYRVIVGE